MSADNNVIISVKDLKKYYNDGEVKALDGVTTDIKKGEVVVVIGPSGSGKSTLLYTVSGMDNGDSLSKAETIARCVHEKNAQNVLNLLT